VTAPRDTQVGPLPTRLPADARTRLRRLARRGIELCIKDDSRGARLIVHLCEGMERALDDLEAAELKAGNAIRSRLKVETQIAKLRAEIDALERAREFARESTAVRPSTPVLESEIALRGDPKTAVRAVPRGVR
jgi:hypothetical protein